MKRKWLMIPLVTGILAAGITGATVLAHNNDGENESPKDAVAAKVAEILGIDQQTVKDALQEATQEVRSDRLQHRLDDLVAAEKMTPEEAEAYLEWYEARPEGPNPFRNGHRLFKFGGSGEGEDGRPRHSFGQRESRGQRFGGQDFPGLGELRSRFGQNSEGQGFSGLGELRSRFGQSFEGQNFPDLDELRSTLQERFGGQRFSGQGLLPPALGGEAPEAEGTSY